MAAEKPAHDLSESAALYIAGALSDEEAVAFEQRWPKPAPKAWQP